MSEVKASRYVFSRIPNTDEGRELLAQMKKYFNRDRYKIRVYGQGLIEGHRWKNHRYGAPLSLSTHLRVYIEERK
jgi:hypothetical protein